MNITLEKHFLKDSNVPIERSYYDRLSGEDCAEATDWEYDGVSCNEDQKLMQVGPKKCIINA